MSCGTLLKFYLDMIGQNNEREEEKKSMMSHCNYKEIIKNAGNFGIYIGKGYFPLIDY